MDVDHIFRTCLQWDEDLYWEGDLDLDHPRNAKFWAKTALMNVVAWVTL